MSERIKTTTKINPKRRSVVRYNIYSRTARTLLSDDDLLLLAEALDDRRIDLEKVRNDLLRHESKPAQERVR